MEFCHRDFFHGVLSPQTGTDGYLGSLIFGVPGQFDSGGVNAL